MSDQKFPAGWDEKRVARVIEHYDAQSDVEAIAEDEERAGEEVVLAKEPFSPMGAVRAWIARHRLGARG